MVELKLICSNSPRKTILPPLLMRLLQKFNSCSAPTYQLKKIDPFQFKKGEGTENKA